MRRPCAIVVATGLCSLAFSASLALAGATSQNIPPVDPTAKNLTPYMISLRAFDACLIVQSRLQSKTREAVHTPCSCYAKLTVKNMSKEELDAFARPGISTIRRARKPWKRSTPASCRVPRSADEAGDTARVQPRAGKLLALRHIRP